MSSFYQAGCDKEKFPRFFDPANDCDGAPVDRSPNDFVACSAGVTGESPSNPTRGYSHLNVSYYGEHKIDCTLARNYSATVLVVKSYARNLLSTASYASASRSG